jgi:hypothetical protein
VTWRRAQPRDGSDRGCTLGAVGEASDRVKSRAPDNNSASSWTTATRTTWQKTKGWAAPMDRIEWFRVLATPVTTLIAATTAAIITWTFNKRQLAIADAQKSIASAKLNLDLYDKRFNVFIAARRFLGEFEKQGGTSVEEIRAFSSGVAEGIFLFDNQVKEYWMN